LFPWQLRQFVQPIPIFLAYLIPLEVNVVPIKFHHHSVWQLLGVEQIQNGGRYHNQGAKNVKFTPYSGSI
jgi:hypothetical protein